MTEDKIALRTLLEKGSDATFLRDLIGFAAERLMELEAEGLCRAGHGERSFERRNQRNGYRLRDWQTRAGTVELRIRHTDAYPFAEGRGDRVRRPDRVARDGSASSRVEVHLSW